jgi:hypothetical protein
MTHDDAFLLLPWYVNHTLDDDERRAVEVHVRDCVRCAEEIRLLERARAGMAELRAAEAAPAPDRLAGVLARVRSSTGTTLDAPGATQIPVSGTAPLRSPRASTAARWWWPATPGLARLALAAQLLLVLGLGVWIAALYANRAAVTASGGDSEQARIAIAFQPHITEERLRRTLRDIDGTIVDGPSAVGLYTVALELPADSMAAVERVLDGLRRDTALVRAAEPVR